MIITERFVLLNFPKTGSTFIRNALKELYDNKSFSERLLNKIGFKKYFLKELILPNMRTKKARELGRKCQHGAYSQIPKTYQGLPILAGVRNPLDRMVSSFEFRFWADNLIAEEEEIKNRIPSFPQLTFEEFWEYMLVYEKKMCWMEKMYKQMSVQ